MAVLQLGEVWPHPKSPLPNQNPMIGFDVPLISVASDSLICQQWRLRSPYVDQALSEVAQVPAVQHKSAAPVISSNFVSKTM